MSSTDRSILRFILRTVLTAAPPLLLLIIWYVCADPYKVLRHYDCYLPDPTEYPARIGMNKGMVTVNNFADRLAHGYSYNAFIFGSSISCYYDADVWQQLADTSGRARAYHFDSSSESLQSMADKVEYLDRLELPLDFALVILDPIIMGGDEPDGPAFASPPQLQKSLTALIRWHYTFFRAAANADFLKSWIPARITGIPVQNGRNMIFEPQPIVYDPVANQESLPAWDSLISNNPEAFYREHPLRPSPSGITIASPLLRGKRAAAMSRIVRIFRKHHTDFQIVIGPNRMKTVLNPADLRMMQSIFGSDRVHDYSFTLAHELEQDTLLYDNTHYRPIFAERIMNLVYQRRR